MTHYFFRHEHTLGEGKFTVAKMDKNFEFIGTYSIVLNKYNEQCNCPSYKQPCKHMRYLKEWLAQPIEVRHRMHFNDKSGLWELPPEGLDPDEITGIADASERYLNKTRGGS